MARKKRKGKGRKHVNAKPCTFNGIKFKSILEKECYKAFKNAGIPIAYEAETIQILDKFKDPAPFYKTWGKSILTERTDAVSGIEYTPDFVDKLDNPHYGFYIEVKGRANEAYPMRIKMFRLWRKNKGVNKEFYEVSNKKEIDMAIELIKQNL